MSSPLPSQSEGGYLETIPVDEVSTTTAEPTATGTIDEPNSDTTVTATGTTRSDGFITTTTSTATTTITDLPILLPAFPNPTFLSNHAASISSAGAFSATTLVLSCTLPTTTSCGDQEPTILLTTGPSTLEYTYWYDISNDLPNPYSATVTHIVRCDLGYSADCTTTGIEWTSTNSATASTTQSETGTIAAQDFTFSAVPITAGAEKLLETPVTAVPVPTAELDAGEESKAWIAGPVVGGVVGLLLIGGLVWFFLRRRRRRAGAGVDMAAELEGSEGSKEKSELSGDSVKAELPVREVATAELPGDRRQKDTVHELP
ncbi:hypothetical protein BJY04DRAFT_204087 [Aspergillus karnatakaensis]|uniref:uncharacterized protein n=1 Tax=Aspergillus karnatakaensis TaxID=1810916 RepID=UPI003CCCA7BB